MNMKRGFITVATGNWYCYLAQNLVMSYKLFSDTKYPFYVITDKAGEKKLKKYFDGVVVLDNPNYNFLDKIEVYNNSPFDETVFIDADADIVSDISFLFDDFEANQSDISCVGAFRTITEENAPNHFGKIAVDTFNIKQYIAFNGGIYYFKKSESSEKCLDFIYNDLIPNYDKYQLLTFRNGQMADEPLFGLAMVVLGFRPLDIDKDIMELLQKTETLSWNFREKKCSFLWYGMTVSPIVLHYGTHNTYSKKYVCYNSSVKCLYKQRLKCFFPIVMLKDLLLLLIAMAKREDYRKAFREWVFNHFTKEHFEYRKRQIKKIISTKKGA